jgi:hypothetical protein
MIFNTLQEPFSQMENEFYEGRLEILIDILNPDKLLDENHEAVKSDLYPETYEPMAQADQELINELWKNSIHRIQ